jgi:hypothetical protein
LSGRLQRLANRATPGDDDMGAKVTHRRRGWSRERPQRGSAAPKSKRARGGEHAATHAPAQQKSP